MPSLQIQIMRKYGLEYYGVFYGTTFITSYMSRYKASEYIKKVKITLNNNYRGVVK